MRLQDLDSDVLESDKEGIVALKKYSLAFFNTYITQFVLKQKKNCSKWETKECINMGIPVDFYIS